MYSDRVELYKELEVKRDSAVIVYVTGDRRGLETQIHEEALDPLAHHLDEIGSVDTISLYLYTRGGQTLAAWSIANLIGQYCNKFEVIIPAKAHSAGTLLSLAAYEIIMTKQATLGPIDPSVNTPLNPQVPGAPPEARMPVSVEAINGFFELAKEIGVKESGDLASVLELLSSQVHPLVLGQVYRTRSQIKMLGRRLLAKHMKEDKNIEKILSFLCSESGSHDYTIYRQEARDELHLNVREPDPPLYAIIKSIYDDMVQDLNLNEPYNAHVLRAGKEKHEYNFRRALVESVKAGSDCFVSRGQLTKQSIVDQKRQIVQEGTQDTRTFEGWVHEV